ncbi:EefX protein [Klebsiella pneumoniae]|nr:EefX protein [Klebsiella pneumoniae]HBX2120415.1 EefX protein [Klebsiella pneumoniae]HBX3403393.1 EefX protein [Klebsiella pneumoniae]HBX6130402.1 EefX protein [Klebsiella pneumoniae]HBX7799839.1 EefX protein [Klebsiella pneumoniae]
MRMIILTTKPEEMCFSPPEDRRGWLQRRHNNNHVQEHLCSFFVIFAHPKMPQRPTYSLVFK